LPGTAIPDRVDQEQIAFDLPVTRGRLKISITNVAFMVAPMAQPTTGRLYRSIQTAKYPQPAQVWM
jgi:hypothetical protein